MSQGTKKQAISNTPHRKVLVKPEPIAHVRKSDQETQALSIHLFDASKICAKTAKKMQFEIAGALLGLIHDLGKYSDEFQIYLRSAVGLLNQDKDEDWVDAAKQKGKVDHSTAGAQYIWRKLLSHTPEDSTKTKTKLFAAQMLALIVASHHSGLINCLAPELANKGEDLFNQRLKKEEENTHFLEVCGEIDAHIREELDRLLTSPELIACFSDFQKRLVAIETHHKGNREICDFKRGLLARFLLSALVEGDHRNSADFEGSHQKANYPPPIPDWTTLCERLEKKLKTFLADTPINRVRAKIAQHCLEEAQRPLGIYTLTVPTGGGKTLASLRFALNHAKKHNLDRIIYVIPFTTIIDQNAQEVRKILEPEGVEAGSILLEHHSNLLPEKITWQHKLHSENWDVPIIYTTSVQCLEALFGSGTRNVRRMHTLCRSVLIFDEIQALPLKCAHMFANAMNFLVEHAGSSVVLCTATQPLLQDIDKNAGAIRLNSDYPELMPDAEKLFSDLARTRIENKISAEGFSNQEAADFVCEVQETYPSVLLIVNTKTVAREIFSACEKKMSKKGVALYHLSTSMCPAHRLHILAEIREKLDPKNPQPIMCISTQLIEAGVDVSFSSVVRSLAGADSVAQAAGRCNRHQEKEGLAPVFILNLSEENLKKLPEISIGQKKTRRILNEIKEYPEILGENLLAPKAISQYFKYAFYERKQEMSYPIQWKCKEKEFTKDEEADACLLELLGSNPRTAKAHKDYYGKESDLPLKQSFYTASEKFQLIDAPTKSVVVPYGKEGEDICTELFSFIHPAEKGELLRRAQSFSVNLYPHELQALEGQKAVRLSGLDVLCLKPEFYHDSFGLSMEACKKMSSLTP